MTWPSSEKLRAVLRAGRRAVESYGTSTPGSSRAAGETRLRDRELVYLFTFVPDPEAAFDFYHGLLGLNVLECSPCKRGTTEHARGVVKYDGGGLMLSTHYRDVPAQEDAASAAAQMRGLAPVLHVSDLPAVTRRLSGNGIECSRPERTDAGVQVKFADPFGRTFILLEPGPEARGTPVGQKIASIVSARL
jgi:predicted enzyme related to lactoylglutathione lyase